MVVKNGLGTVCAGGLLGPVRGDPMALRPWWLGRVYAHPPSLMILRDAACGRPHLYACWVHGLRKEDWEVGVLYHGHGRETPAGASTMRTLLVTQTETCPGTGLDLGL